MTRSFCQKPIWFVFFFSFCLFPQNSAVLSLVRMRRGLAASLHSGSYQICKRDKICVYLPWFFQKIGNDSYQESFPWNVNFSRLLQDFLVKEVLFCYNWDMFMASIPCFKESFPETRKEKGRTAALSTGRSCCIIPRGEYFKSERRTVQQVESRRGLHVRFPLLRPVYAQRLSLVVLEWIGTCKSQSWLLRFYN